jgi:predicted amidohydrolase
MTAASSIIVAAAQYPLDAVPDMQAWELKAEQWATAGAATGARLLVFPEYGAIELAAACGPEVSTDLDLTLAAVADRVGETADVWRRLAARHGVYILAPSGPERRSTGYVNATRLYGPGGGSSGQDKLILTPFERDWGMAAGNGQRVFDTALGRIGVAICYDSEFPLLVRALAEAGADIVLIPSCTEHVSGFHRVRNAAMARALESQIATVMSPTVGPAPWSPAVDRNCGAAGVFVPPDVSMSPTGVLAEGALDQPGWINARIDLDALRALRTRGEMRNHHDWMLQRGSSRLGGDVEVVLVE